MKINGPLRKSPKGLTSAAPCIAVLAVCLFGSHLALAQDAPTPRKMPREPVKREVLAGEKAANTLKSRDLSGTATVIDSEHLKLADVDLRLFGVVPPQLSASFGPQARTALDDLTKGQMTECHVRDRDHDGRFLATCSAGTAKTDLALELLRRGLAVTARGSLQPTELAASYEAAEAGAQKEKLGIWTTAVPPVAQASVPQVTSPFTAKADNPNLPPLPTEIKKEEKPTLAEKLLPEKLLAEKAPEKSLEKAPERSSLIVPNVLPPTLEAAQASASGDVNLANAKLAAQMQMALDDNNGNASSFFARYQLLITGLVMLATALGIMIVLASERRRDRRDELRAIGAALRGELLAARAVCQGRLRTWSDMDEKGSWPRVRATLYQAYVGKLGWLGATLARQVASIYGQSSDYAAYFGPNGTGVDQRNDAPTKRQALQVLVQHIEEVLPKLATIEQTGLRPKQVLAPITQGKALVPRQASQVAYEAGSQSPQPYDEPPQRMAALAAPPSSVFTNVMRRLLKHTPPPPPAEEHLTDYTALLEEEMQRMSAEEETSPNHSYNVTKMRGNGG